LREPFERLLARQEPADHAVDPRQEAEHERLEPDDDGGAGVEDRVGVERDSAQVLRAVDDPASDQEAEQRQHDAGMMNSQRGL